MPLCVRRKAANRCTLLRRKAVTTDRLKGMPPATVGSCSSFAFSHHLTCSEIISCAQRAACGRVCLECQSFLHRNPLLAYKGKLLKATPAEIGMAGSLFGVTQLITAPLIGRSHNRSTYPCTWLASAILFGRLRGFAASKYLVMVRWATSAMNRFADRKGRKAIALLASVGAVLGHSLTAMTGTFAVVMLSRFLLGVVRHGTTTYQVRIRYA